MTLTEFKEECQTLRVNFRLATPEHQETNRQVGVTWRRLRTISHSRMVHTRVSEAYIRFSLIYPTNHIFLVLPIKDLIKEGSDLTTPFKLARGTKSSVSHLRMLFLPSVVQKATAHVDKKALNMCHQAQNGFHGIFVGIP